MATRVTEIKYDDIDESTDDVRTVKLSLDGQEVEIDLSGKNYEKLSQAVAPYLEAGRRTSSKGSSARRRRGSATGTSSSGGGSVDTTAVRKWAEANGIPVNSRGRIKADVIAQYQAAGN